MGTPPWLCRWRTYFAKRLASGGYDFAQIADMNLDGHGDVVLYRDGNNSPGFVDVYGGVAVRYVLR